MKIMFPKITHEDEKGRHTGENIRLLYNVLVYTEKTKTNPGLLLNVDFEKAFWDLFMVIYPKGIWFLIKKSFYPDIEQWIKSFFKSANTLFNRHYSGWFHIQRRVRQGDPCSPYLYLNCAEILLSMFRQNQKVKGTEIREKYALMAVSDDITLCLDGS